MAITIKCSSKKELDTLREQKLQEGYRIVEEAILTKGVFLVVDTPLYHKEIDGKFVFQRDEWLDKEIRPRRNKLLRESDWCMIYDVRTKMSEEELNKWLTYRQKLRDLPRTLETAMSINDVTWPKEPE